MTLLDILPSLRGATTPRLDPNVWPATTHCRHGRITVGGIPLDEIADRFGSPAYVIDEWSLRGAARSHRKGFRDVEVLSSTSSVISSAVARLVARHGLSLVVHSAHELAIARHAGVDPTRIVLVANSAESAGPVGRIVVDSGMSLDTIAASATAGQKVIVRVHTSRCAAATIERVVDTPALDLVGVRCDSAPVPDDIYEQVLTAAAVLCDAQRTYKIRTSELHVGIATGGEVPGADLGAALENAVDDACMRNRLPRPRVSVDFGESVTARAAVTVSRVRSVDRSIEGRPALVLAGGVTTGGVGIAAAVVNRHPIGMTETFAIVGSPGSGVVLPQNIRSGDVVALVSRDGSDLLASSNVVAVIGGDARRLHR